MSDPPAVSPQSGEAIKSVHEASKAENLFSQDQNVPLFNCFKAFDQAFRSLIAGWLVLRL